MLEMSQGLARMATTIHFWSLILLVAQARFRKEHGLQEAVVTSGLGSDVSWSTHSIFHDAVVVVGALTVSCIICIMRQHVPNMWGPASFVSCALRHHGTLNDGPLFCSPDLLHFEQQAANLNVTSPECAKWCAHLHGFDSFVLKRVHIADIFSTICINFCLKTLCRALT